MNTVHWFRADLRLADNTALSEAAARSERLACLFVLDDALLASPRMGAARLRFLRGCLEALAADLAKRGHRLALRRGDPRRAVAAFAREVGAQRVFWNRDTTPYARRRDAAVEASLAKAGISAHACKDRVVFEGAELRTGEGRGYQVFTPFRNRWLARFREAALPEPRPLRLPAPLAATERAELLGALARFDEGVPLPPAGEAAARRRLAQFCTRAIGAYAEARDIPGIDGTSRLSHHLRFGTLSARACVRAAQDTALEHPQLRGGAMKWQDELIWREFYAAVLEEHPRVLTRAFRPEYDAVRWNEDPSGFAAWCAGRTGYPIVDAGMRQLVATGWMHNRARMIAASFLTKDLLVDWRRGEHFFLQHLVDGDPASNNGGWQWSASTGTDAQPYFRIFSPTAQGERFDPTGAFVRRWIPELRDVPDKLVHRPWEAPMLAPEYPARVVMHEERRVEAVRRFEAVRKRA
ncbi:MAG: deoxyribodipyrimidine photo-lyase [Deltaproteobacteria bacterium]|nr:deoxyribodipyrimidine photo-lyase [Deltaproteobacteria bacterium]